MPNDFWKQAEEILQILMEALDDVPPMRQRLDDMERLLKSAEKKANDLRNALKLNGGTNGKDRPADTV